MLSVLVALHNTRILADGLTGDGIATSTATVIAALLVFVLGVWGLVQDRKKGKKAIDQANAAAQKRIEELSDLMDQRHQEQLARVGELYESRIADIQTGHARELAQLKRQLAQQRRDMEEGEPHE